MARLDIKLSGARAEWGRLAESRYNALLAVDPCDLSDAEFAEYSAAGDLVAEARALPPAVERAVTRFENASERIAELSAVDAQHLSGADFNALGDAQAAVEASREFLTRAGLLYLVEEVA
ncbi:MULTISPECIES: hypothetical protein [unclassified Streptomyces]|uniref:hypothetical protein n=1 Tax=unclassified Streptomyces TaxID=2593676 RepID=UPI00278C2481|nr:MULTISPECIES: hypothetical protein [unclassified Streptomyces]